MVELYTAPGQIGCKVSIALEVKAMDELCQRQHHPIIDGDIEFSGLLLALLLSN